METAIVTVKQPDHNLERDLEIPIQMEAGIVAGMIAKALDLTDSSQALSQEFRICARTLDGAPRVIQPYERLSDAGIWDGAYLELQMISTRDRTSVARRLTVNDKKGPIEGWKPLDLPSDPEPTEPPDQQGDSGFIWKRIDQ